MQWYGNNIMVLLSNSQELIFLPADINECEEEIDECEEHCYNSIGSYFCNCTGPGYQLHNDGNTCESEYKRCSIHFQYANAHLQMSMNALRALMIALRSVQTLMGVMTAPALLAISCKVIIADVMVSHHCYSVCTLFNNDLCIQTLMNVPVALTFVLTVALTLLDHTCVAVILAID